MFGVLMQMMIIMNEGSYRSIHTETRLPMNTCANAMELKEMMKRKGAKLVACLLLAVILFTSFLLIGTNASGTTIPEKGEQLITVRSGDTLWGIAVSHANAGDNIGYFVYLIKDRNGLVDVAIKPGQKLVIPKLK